MKKQDGHYLYQEAHVLDIDPGFLRLQCRQDRERNLGTLSTASASSNFIRASGVNDLVGHANKYTLKIKVCQ